MNVLEHIADPKIIDNMFHAKAMFVGDILYKNAYLHPNRIALEWQDRKWTFKTLNNEVNRIANGLLQLGINKGERISILTRNCAECCHIFYAGGKIGAILSFINWRWTNQEIVEAMDVIQPSTLIISEEYVEKIDYISSNITYLKNIIVLNDSRKVEFDKQLHNTPFIQFTDLLEYEETEPDVSIDEEDPLYIVYTSGTTGTPKGATISHRATIQRVIAQLATFPTLLNVSKDDVYVAWNPFFHVTPVDQMFATHAMAGKVLILQGFNPKEMVDVMEKEYISWLVLAPGMYDRLINELKSRNANVKGIKAIGSMADLVSKETIAEITQLCNAPFLNTYGSTEMGMHCFSQNILPIGRPGVKYESMAKTEGFFCRVKLVDQNGNQVKDGEPGELLVKTPMLFSGYWGNEEENNKVFADGWYHTGDVFVRTPDGRLDYISRTKHMIKSGGENIYPAEIERILLSHPNIKEAIVISVSDRQWGEVPMAFIATNQKVDAEILKQYCVDQGLAKYKVPKYFKEVSLDDFPRNTTGKIIREEVQKWGKNI